MNQLPNNKPLLVCGSVYISILAKATGLQVTQDQRGDIIFDIGGVASNIASSARNVGTSVRLLTALVDKSPYTKIIVEHLNSLGLEKAIQYEPSMKDPAVCAYLDENGKMVSSVSSIALDSVFFSNEFIHAALLGVMGCVIDTSLSETAIHAIAAQANAANIPVFICASSEDGFVKLKASTAKFTTIFAKESTVTVLSSASADTDVVFNARYAATLAQIFGCPVVVAKEDNTVLIARADGSEAEYLEAIKINSEEKDYHGAEDALSAYCTVHLLYSRRSLKDSLRIAVQAVEEDARERYVNLSDGGGRVDHALKGIGNAASLDHLTKLPNRAAATRKINQLIECGTPFFVAIVDIDHFKSVNDQFGHNAGDEALVLVAKTLANSMRDHDFCGRWGGEEFLIIISRGSKSIDDVLKIMERVRHDVELIQWVSRKLTVSIGVAAADSILESSVEKADKALYQSKKSGRNRVTIHQN